MSVSPHQPANRLLQQSSPYLLQHAYNPVDWYPWGDEALSKAKLEDKMILISVGYSACHWCHVMERESFEDLVVAQIMNEHFVCIKVDREERPDVDQIYMEAVQLMNNGQGGWPLNCFALPDGRPIFGGTYFPKEQWKRVLMYLADFWQNKKAEAFEFADRLILAIQDFETIHEALQIPPQYTVADLARTYIPWSHYFDLEFGGTQRVPKFPLPANWRYILYYAHYSKDEQADLAISVTLKQLALGGIYDQIGGGFARYSTDKYWLVPHFEKMMYDNGQLIALYSEAFHRNPLPMYRDVVFQTVEWIEREMLGTTGGFYCALDADSEGVEGKFYVWTLEELQAILGPKAGLAQVYYNCTAAGNWEHGWNILHRQLDDSVIAERFGLTVAELTQEMLQINQLLLAERANRVRPGLDDKILLSWNALTIKGLAIASRVFESEAFLQLAQKTWYFILNHMADGSRLNRTYNKGKASVNAFLDDYAIAMEAAIELYQATFEESYIHQAKDWLDYVLEHFYDPKSGMFFYTSDIDPPLIARKQEIYDNVIYSSNSALGHVLLTMGYLYRDYDYIHKAEQMLANVAKATQAEGSMHANWAMLMLRLTVQDYQVVITGPYALDTRKTMERRHLFNVIYAGCTSASTLPITAQRFMEGRSQIYICRNQTCLVPTEHVEEAIQAIQFQFAVN
jgi:uncharacterized protein